jgi:hypothetical protein
MGIYPQLFLRRLDTTVTQIIQRVEPSTMTVQAPLRLRRVGQNR